MQVAKISAVTGFTAECPVSYMNGGTKPMAECEGFR